MGMRALRAVSVAAAAILVIASCHHTPTGPEQSPNNEPLAIETPHQEEIFKGGNINQQAPQDEYADWKQAGEIHIMTSYDGGNTLGHDFGWLPAFTATGNWPAQAYQDSSMFIVFPDGERHFTMTTGFECCNEINRIGSPFKEHPTYGMVFALPGGCKSTSVSVRETPREIPAHQTGNDGLGY